MPKSLCCKALFFSELPTMDDLGQEVRKSFLNALRGGCQFSSDNLHLFSMIEPLPMDWDDLPLDLQEDFPRELWESFNIQRWRCKALLPDGRCGCYDHRPYICSKFQPEESACGRCSNFVDGECRPGGADALGA